MADSQLLTADDFLRTWMSWFIHVELVSVYNFKALPLLEDKLS